MVDKVQMDGSRNETRALRVWHQQVLPLKKKSAKTWKEGVIYGADGPEGGWIQNEPMKTLHLGELRGKGSCLVVVVSRVE